MAELYTVCDLKVINGWLGATLRRHQRPVKKRAAQTRRTLGRRVRYNRAAAMQGTRGELSDLRGQLAAHKLPMSVEVIAAISKTGSGKNRRVGPRDREAAKEE